MLRVPYKNYAKKTWEVNFPNRDKEFGDISYVVSEFLEDGLIYEYNRDGMRCHQHDFDAVLSCVVTDIICGHQISFDEFRDEYSDQEYNLLNNLVKKMESEISQYDILPQIDRINNLTKRMFFKAAIEERDNLSVYESKIGGKPYWNKNLKYPCIDGKPLILLAQINFAELPQNDIFPKRGLLQFFIWPYDCGYGAFNDGYKVVYHETLDDLEDINLKIKDDIYTPILKEGKLRFSVDVESISFYDKKFNDFRGYFHSDLMPVLETIFLDHINSGWGSKLLGYPFFSQIDIENRYDKGYDTLLLQLDSDSKFIEWGNMGVGNFFINSEKLRKHDFSDILYTWDN